MGHRALVLGAGKIARGFIGHLLHLAGWQVTFIEVNRRLVDLLNTRRSYRVHVLGNPARSSRIDGVSASTPDRVAEDPATAVADLVFVSVGGANLADAGATIASVLKARMQAGNLSPLNIIVCENWYHAAETLRASILEALESQGIDSPPPFGVAESTIMRSCIEPTEEQRSEDPLAVQAQDFWTMELDEDALVTPFPPIEGMQPTSNFSHALQRKLFTYNMLNATISYTGWLIGHSHLDQAANDPRLQPLIAGAIEETTAAQVAAFGFDIADQREYAHRALRKFQDHAIVDPLTRQIRDPIRKLGRKDRLVGAALLCLDHNVDPRCIAVGIAAALRCRNPLDPAAEQLAKLVIRHGERGALARLSCLPPEHPLQDLVQEQSTELHRLTSGAPAGRPGRPAT